MNYLSQRVKIWQFQLILGTLYSNQAMKLSIWKLFSKWMISIQDLFINIWVQWEDPLQEGIQGSQPMEGLLSLPSPVALWHFLSNSEVLAQWKVFFPSMEHLNFMVLHGQNLISRWRWQEVSIYLSGQWMLSRLRMGCIRLIPGQSNSEEHATFTINWKNGGQENDFSFLKHISFIFFC